jgi:cytochrome P450
VDTHVPQNKKQVYHLENIAPQLLIAGWQHLAEQFYSSLFFLLREPDAYNKLVDEVRRAFAKYEAISTDTIGNLKYLQACSHEILRLHQETVDDLPRVSPGAVVAGEYMPQVVSFDNNAR